MVYSLKSVKETTETMSFLSANFIPLRCWNTLWCIIPWHHLLLNTGLSGCFSHVIFALNAYQTMEDSIVKSISVVPSKTASFKEKMNYWRNSVSQGRDQWRKRTDDNSFHQDPSSGTPSMVLDPLSSSRGLFIAQISAFFCVSKPCSVLDHHSAMLGPFPFLTQGDRKEC